MKRKKGEKTIVAAYVPVSLTDSKLKKNSGLMLQLQCDVDLCDCERFSLSEKHCENGLTWSIPFSLFMVPV